MSEIKEKELQVETFKKQLEQDCERLNKDQICTIKVRMKRVQKELQQLKKLKGVE